MGERKGRAVHHVAYQCYNPLSFPILTHDPIASLLLSNLTSNPVAHSSKMRLIFDFDGTITEKDTISTLARAALTHQNDYHSVDLAGAWDDVVRAYVSDYKGYCESYEIPETQRTTVDAELAFLSGSGHVELASLDRIARSGVFRQLESSHLFEMGKAAVGDGRIVVRDGFADVIELAKVKGWTVGVISVNWSRAFIAGALDGLVSPLSIIANDFAPDGSVLGPESLDSHPLTNGTGKLNVLEGDESLRHAGQGTGTTVYFGDSTTDMECLLRGGGAGNGGGVAIASDENGSNLISTLRRVSLPVPHVTAAATNSDSGVYWARNFREVIDSDALSRLGLN